MASYVGAAVQWGKGKVSSAISALRGPPSYKLLLIGETGSGKTSFLNLLCNCALIDQLGYDEGSKDFRDFNDIALENPDKRKMESKTGDAKLYRVNLNDLKIGVIDTPGFGDSRGTAEDVKHTARIVDALKNEEYVNCICLVVNGRGSRMTATVKYVLTEITSILPRQVLGSIIVVFTNTADPLELNFDTDQFQTFFGRDIAEDRIFCVENPYCRLTKAKQKQGKLSAEKIAKSLAKSFSETREVLSELSTTIKDFPRVHTHHFATLYETKQEIERKVMASLTAINNHTVLEAQIEAAEKKAKAALQTKTLYTNYRSTQRVKRWKQVQTNRHNTLCGARGCYSNCHFECTLDKSFDKETFRYCGAMGGESTCRVCGHHYAYHHHDEVKHVEEEAIKEWVDEEMKSKFEQAKTMEERERILTQKLEKDKEESQQAKQQLSRQLLLTIEEFQKLGVSRNYAIVLENQLAMVQQHMEGSTGDEKALLRETWKTIEKKLKVVRETLSEPWRNTDPVARREWACKMLEVSTTASEKEIETAYRSAARATHPDKSGDEDYFKRIQHAHDVLLPK